MRKPLLTVLLAFALSLISFIVFHHGTNSTRAVVTYHCSMHPNVVTSKPGNCPICGMSLIPLTPVTGPPQRMRERAPIRIYTEQQRVLGIHLAEAREMPFERIIRLTGHISMAPPSRIMAEHTGIVDEVYHAPGTVGAARLRPGAPILSFSRVLFRAAKPLVLAAVPYPGQNIQKGQNLYTYIDLSTMSVLADIKSSDILSIKSGLPAEATLPSHPGRIWRGKVVESSEQFDERMQTLKVKFDFPNDTPDLWQGMLVRLDLHAPGRHGLAVPESAVIMDGEEAIVFVAQPGNVFEPRNIQPGLISNDLVEIQRGLSPGERVVASAIFLLDAESRLNATTLSGETR